VRNWAYKTPTLDELSTPNPPLAGFLLPAAKPMPDSADRKTASARGYGRRWQKARLTYLANHPLCCQCERRGLVVASTVVDHVTPHHGDQQLFWDSSNWQALCSTCHDSWKKALEQGGPDRSGCDESGQPVSNAHHWNRPARSEGA
jgi:5-methylcytosine-specific restriction protein A